jgi:hypothetical protein
MNRTLIITGSTPDMFPVLDLTLASKQTYAGKHGYDFLVKRKWEGSSKYHFKQYENHLLGYHKPGLGILGFMRVVICFEQLRDYDVVMWLDGDSVVTNSEITVEEMIREDGVFYASTDWSTGSKSFSTGNFIVKRHKQTNFVFEKFLEYSKPNIGHVLQEQITLNQLYMSHIPDIKNILRVLPRRYLNSVPRVQEKMNTWRLREKIEEPWTPECFIAHLTGLTSEERIEIISGNHLNYK